LHAFENESLKNVFSNGKELWFAFSNERVLAMHLMLKGKLEMTSEVTDVKYPIFALCFTKSKWLTLTDPLGMANVTLDPSNPKVPDALDSAVDFEFLKSKLMKSKNNYIKSFLIDQKNLRGIGNAYADEILWSCKISPESICGKLPDEAIRSLVVSIPNVLRNAVIELEKATPDAISGEYRDFLSVHQTIRKESLTGFPILIKEIATKRTYYTQEQILYD